jgi:PAS domain S-box-containing protein
MTMKALSVLTILPIALFAGLVIVLFGLGISKPIFEPPYLILVTNTIFLTGSSLVVALISARSYIKGAPMNILVLGCAFLINGIAAAVAGWLFSFSANYTVTIYNSCTLLSAILQIVNATFSHQGSGSKSQKTTLGLKLLSAYIVSVAVIIFISAITYYGFTPKFFVEGSGPTLVDTSVLATTILLFTASSLILVQRQVKSKSAVLLWYSAGLALFAIGLFSVALEKSIGDPLGWTGKIAQYAGGIFFIIAVIKARDKTESGNMSYTEGWTETFTASREQIASLFANMGEGFAFSKIIRDNRGKPKDIVILEINEAWEKLTGIKKESVIGKKFTQVIPGIEKEPFDFMGKFVKISTTGEPEQFEVFINPLGKFYSISAYSPKKDYFVALFTDITERKKAEEAARESEKQLRLILENSRDGINMLDLKTGKYAFMSPAQVKLTGFTAEEISNFTAEEAYQRTHPDDREITIAQQRKVAAGEDVSEPVEYRWKVKSGEYRWFSDSRKLVRDEKGQAIALVGISRDSTKRKKAEEQVRINEERFRSVLNNSLDVIYRLNLQTGCYEYMSSASKALLGFDPEELMAMSNKEMFSRVHPDDLPILLSTLSNATETGKGSCDYRFLGKDGNYRWWSNQIVISKDSEGKPLYRDGFVRDVTEHKKAEEKIVEYQRNLEKLVEQRTKELKDSERLATIGATAGMVGHDIRNPLQAITSDVYLVKSEVASLPKGEEKESIKESLEGIEKNVEYINKIVQDLQDYARPLVLSIRETDLETLFSEVLVKKAIPENISSSSQVKQEAKKLKTDPAVLKRVLANLVNNAVQAMPKGGELEISAYHEGDDTFITVKDTGVGIPDELRPKLFTPLFTTKSKGQGFGLAVIKRMTEALGGTVDFESEEGKGTKFIIRLPPQKMSSNLSSNKN